MNLKSFFLDERKALSEDLRKDFEHLILEKLNVNRLDLQSQTKTIDETQLKIINQDLIELKKGKPLAYILKSQFFLGYDFYVDHRVLIPRSETEFMMDYCLKHTDDNFKIVFDAGAGSGCLGISYLLKRKNSKCVFMENSKEAIEVIKINLEKFNIPKDRYIIAENFKDFESNPFYKDHSKIDLFVSNPPYISEDDLEVQSSVLNFEPHSALFCKDQGLDYLKKWSLQAIKYLNPKIGFGIFEFGQNQEIILQTFGNQHKMNSSILLDQYERPRFWKINA